MSSFISVDHDLVSELHLKDFGSDDKTQNFTYFRIYGANKIPLNESKSLQNILCITVQKQICTEGGKVVICQP